MKKILITLLLIINIYPSNVQAVCPPDICPELFAIMEAKIPKNTILYTSDFSSSCCNPQVRQKNTYIVIGHFTGLDAQLQAQAAVPGGTLTSQSTGYPACAAGWYSKRTTEVNTSKTCTKCDGNTATYAYQEYKTVYALFVNSECDPEYTYCVTKGYACANGAAVLLEYEICDIEGFPTGSKSQCGNVTMASKIDSGEVDGQIFENSACGCDKTQDEILEMCAQIDATDSACEDCSAFDQDEDGINDCDDNCPDTPPGDPVSEQGCPLDDSDGDGVPDEIDQCPNTSKNTPVDAWGCPLPDDDQDTDGDGIKDKEDKCPDEGGVVNADGCPIDNPQGDPNPAGGDQDNDNALLEGIITWLKKLVQVSDQTNEHLEDTNDHLKSANEELQEINEKLDTENVNTDLPDDEEFTSDLPDDIETIDINQDFMSDFLENLLTNNAFINQITGSSLNASGACSLSSNINLMGKSVNLQFSICDYDLTIFRTMILMIAGLTGFFIVFRKG